jgi:hypothetical protein
VTTRQPVKPGLSAPIVTSIPNIWSAAWFRNFITNYLQNADIRNATQGGGVTVSGGGTGPATLTLTPLPPDSVLGNATASTAAPTAVSAAQLTSLINLFTATKKGAVPPPGLTRGFFLRDDGTWQAIVIPVSSVAGGVGPPGLDGDPGEEGMPIPGPAGLPGAAGATGATGPTVFGIAGLDGDPGEEGMPIPGPQGIQGPQGIPGPSGSGGGGVGPPGLDGDPGDDGMPIPGPIGPQGPQGIPGTSGGGSTAAGFEILYNEISLEEQWPQGLGSVYPSGQLIVNGQITQNTGAFGITLTGNALTFLGTGVNTISNSAGSGSLLITGGSQLSFNTNAGGQRISVSAANSVNILNPGNNVFALTLSSSGGAGFSKGLLINGGTNTSDVSMQVLNASGSVQQFEIFGDGGVTVGPNPVDRGLGSLNVQSLYVNGVPIGNTAANAAILAFEFYDEDQWPQGVGTNYPSGALNVNGPVSYNPTLSTGTSVPTIGTNKPGSAVTLGPVTWETVVLNGTTYFRPLWQ